MFRLSILVLAAVGVTATAVYAQGGGISNGSGRAQDRASACTKAIDNARLFVPSGSEVISVKCECAEETGAVANALGKWSCVGLVSYNSLKRGK